MSSFKKAIEETLNNEGVYSNDKTDRGGETCFGISRLNWPSWDGWSIVDEKTNINSDESTLIDSLSSNNDLMDKVLEFYKDNFWNNLHCDEIKSDKISKELFDTAINMGIRTASKFLQSAINLILQDYSISEDGRIGPNTIRAYNSVTYDAIGEIALLNAIKGMQFLRYKKIIEGDATQKKYIRGWLNRI